MVYVESYFTVSELQINELKIKNKAKAGFHIFKKSFFLNCM